MSKDDIATYFKVKPGRAYYMIEAAKKINDNTIKNLIERITKLDFDIKSGKIDKKLGLQLFILGA
jgi:DNA polymerase-3 subunit delta